MKRLHVHVAVGDLEKSIGFYSALFGAQPSKVKPDYAKWMLEDPRINFAISTRGAKPGVDHLGIQVDAPEELQNIREHFRRADLEMFDEGATTCCYASSDKSWVQDPSGIAWEAYHTMSDAELFSTQQPGEAACCAPAEAATPVNNAVTASGGCCG